MVLYELKKKGFLKNRYLAYYDFFLLSFTEIGGVDFDLADAKISGHRIVDLGYVLSWAVTLQYEHSKKCPGQLYAKKEHSRGLGFVRRVQFNCTVCSDQIEHSTERPTENKVSLINYGAVWGTLSIGSTYGQLDELMCSLDVPPMPKSMFLSIEQDLGEVPIPTYLYES